jgi:hypothetical protein
MLLPWLNDVVRLREANALAPSAPTEMLVLTSAFALLTVGALFLIARMSFFQVLVTRPTQMRERSASNATVNASRQPSHAADTAPQPSRAATISDSIAASIRREERVSRPDRTTVWSNAAQRQDTGTQSPDRQTGTRPATLLGDEFRKSRRRVSGATIRRDRTP